MSEPQILQVLAFYFLLAEVLHFKSENWDWWSMPVIPATQEVEIGRIEV
jgi:hypothetical protein